MHAEALQLIEPAAHGQRERAKEDRRRRIVQAAHDLLRDSALDAISGRMIADRAHVSLSTVYNLFGSKDAVLMAVYAEDLRHYEDLVGARASRDALERLFDAIEVATQLYANDPDFYRGMLVRPAPGEALDVALRQPRNLFWENLVRNARHEGAILPDVDVARLTRVLVHQFSGALGEWIGGDLALDQFERDVTFGFAATLVPFATPAAAQRLRGYLKPENRD